MRLDGVGQLLDRMRKPADSTAPAAAVAPCAAEAAGTESPDQARGEHPHLFLDLPPLRPAMVHATVLCIETLVAPTLIFMAVEPPFGLFWGLVASLGWCYALLGVRAIARRRMPGTLLLTTSMFTARTALALATSSAFVYLAQPALGSVVTAGLFLVSAVIGRPLSLRLCRDFIAIPPHLEARHRVRRMFRDVAVIWGTSRVLSAAMSLGLLFESTRAGLFARGVFSPALTVLTIGICAIWGRRSLRADGIRLRLARAAAQPSG